MPAIKCDICWGEHNCKGLHTGHLLIKCNYSWVYAGKLLKTHQKPYKCTFSFISKKTHKSYALFAIISYRTYFNRLHWVRICVCFTVDANPRENTKLLVVSSPLGQSPVNRLEQIDWRTSSCMIFRYARLPKSFVSNFHQGFNKVVAFQFFWRSFRLKPLNLSLKASPIYKKSIFVF